MGAIVKELLPPDCARVDGTLPEDGKSHTVGGFDVRVSHGAEFFQTFRPDRPCVLQEMLDFLGRQDVGRTSETTEGRSCGRCGLFISMTAVRREGMVLAES